MLTPLLLSSVFLSSMNMQTARAQASPEEIAGSDAKSITNFSNMTSSNMSNPNKLASNGSTGAPPPDVAGIYPQPAPPLDLALVHPRTPSDTACGSVNYNSQFK